MTNAPALATAQQIAAALSGLAGWERVGDELHVSYQLPSFVAAVQLTVDVAQVAERIRHHPEWRVAYRRVSILTTTHDAGGISARDFELAAEISALAAAAGAAVLGPG